MKIDLVHDIQKIYRTILSCFASPGSIGDLSHEGTLIDIDCPLNPGYLLLALTLLDAETTLSVVSENSGAHGSFFSRMTNTVVVSSEDAAFVFACLNRTSVILGARRGTLVDPHLGATIIFEVDALQVLMPGTKKIEERTDWKLSGPGIKSSTLISFFRQDTASIVEAFLARNEACGEFPLGVDLIIFDATYKIMCIPRTTIMEEM